MRYLLLIAALFLAAPAQAQGVIDGYNGWRAVTGGGSDPDFIDAGTLVNLIATEQTDTTEDVPMPTGHQAGDFLVVVAAYRNTISTPSGWTAHSDSGCYNSAWGFGVFVASRVDTGSEPSALTITGLTASQPFKAIILRFSDASSVDDVACSSNGAAAVTDHTTDDVTPTNSPGLTLTAAGIRYGSSFTISVSPSTPIVVDGSPGDGNHHGLGISYTQSSGTSAQGGGLFTTTASLRDAMITMAIH